MFLATLMQTEAANEDKERMELCNYYKSRAKKVDKISRVAFPVVFALFMIVYMSVYTQQRNK